MHTEAYGIHWFRRDLRITGNPALQYSWKKMEGRVVGIFCFDKNFLARKDFSSNRFQFFLETLKTLHTELKAAGSDLLFLDDGPFDAFPKLFQELENKGYGLPSLITWNRDYEPYAKERDSRMEKLLDRSNILFHTERDHLLLEPHELYKDQDPTKGYQVYTPFSKKWKELFRTPEVQGRIQLQVKALKKASKTKEVFRLKWSQMGFKETELLETYIQKNLKNVTIAIPKVGLQNALLSLTEFSGRLKNYETQRDIPSAKGTSQISPFLKNGSITTNQIIAKLELNTNQSKKSEEKYLNELIWREFYYHILARNPRVEHEAFLPQYISLKWENREDRFRAWQEGITGFPIVDAGMRQLNTTGWMHNRVRMIVASFLTKDLLIDWRWGERYFMEKLIDGDLAPNNGGWQWAASTGCDPQPYFRIFNPVLQSKRFDPTGSYIKKYIPELSHLDAKTIHEPASLERNGYPEPIVDHSEQRNLALALFSKARANKT